MRMKKMRIRTYRNIYNRNYITFTGGIPSFSPFPTEAADAQSITLKDATARLSIGETKTIQVDYSKLKGGYAGFGELQFPILLLSRQPSTMPEIPRQFSPFRPRASVLRPWPYMP